MALNTRERFQEFVQGIPTFDEIEKGLNWDTGSGEARSPVHDLFVNGHDARQGGSFLGGHSPKVGDLSLLRQV